MSALPERPIRIDSLAGPMAGWWHGVATASPLAVVLCAPWGDEDLGSYRGLRELAQALAQAGWPVLRFDWPGQGDSFDAGLTEGADAWPVWLAALDLAVATARGRSGAGRVVLIGLRMAALLAAHVAARRDDIAALALLLPPASGRAWLREATMLGAAVASPAARAVDDGVWLGGFRLSAATAASVRAAVWPAVAGPVVDEVLLLDASQRPLAAASQDALAALSRVLRHEPRDDLGRLTVLAHEAHWPPALSARLVAWLAALSAAAGPAPWAPANLASAGTDGDHAADAEFEGLVERFVQVPAAVPCVGVLCRQAASTSTALPRRGVLLLSSGAERRIGPHRLWVPWARERARRGEVVLRLDLPGVGDSPPREPGKPDDVYDARVVRDLAAAVAWLRGDQGVQQVVVVGLCSGGYHAWRSAVEGLAVDAVMPLNPLVFHWRTGMSLNPMDHDFGRIAVATGVGRALNDLTRWRRLIRGQVNVRVIAGAMAGLAAASLRGWCRALARTLRWPLRNDLASELREVLRRGVSVHFMFAENDPGQWLLRDQAGSLLAASLNDGRVHLTTIPDADHTFAGPEGRSRLYNHLHAGLDRLQSPRLASTSS